LLKRNQKFPGQDNFFTWAVGIHFRKTMEAQQKNRTQVFSLPLQDEETAKTVEYSSLTVHKEKEVVEFSLITSSGECFVGSHVYEDDEHWEETITILKKSPPVTLLKVDRCFLKKLIGGRMEALK
jgi:hypothetical protein